MRSAHFPPRSSECPGTPQLRHDLPHLNERSAQASQFHHQLCLPRPPYSSALPLLIFDEHWLPQPPYPWAPRRITSTSLRHHIGLCRPDRNILVRPFSFVFAAAFQEVQLAERGVAISSSRRYHMAAATTRKSSGRRPPLLPSPSPPPPSPPPSCSPDSPGPAFTFPPLLPRTRS